MATILEKLALLNTYAGKCRYCGGTITLTTMEVDHAIPLGRGGSDSFFNFRSACFWCNRQKGDLTEREFIMRRLLGLA